jgi:membrane protein implicated in regulation of membrane protease activity
MQTLAYYWWFAIALAFFILEIITPGFVLLWFGVGALAVAVLDLLGMHDLLLQVIVFGVVSIILVALSRTIFKNILMRASPGASLRTNADALVDRGGRITEEVNAVAGTGRVLVDGQDWLARSEGGEIIPVNTSVVVVRYEGARLFVRRADAA